MRLRNAKDRFAGGLLNLLCMGVASLLLVMAASLLFRAESVLQMIPLRELLVSTVWSPSQGHFGLASFIIGSLWVTCIAMSIAVPLGMLSAVFVAEYSPQWVNGIAHPVVDVLAGISPVVYGVWGLATIVPLVGDYLMPFLSERFPFFPFASENYTGYSALSGGLVLAVMILPIIVGFSSEVIKAVPLEVREASLSLGATRWETTKWTVLKQAKPGLIAAVILALSRAFGETMAVLMVAGCSLHGTPKSIFDPAYPLPALIANTYGEMMSIPLYDSTILLAAFVLFAVTFAFNAVAWTVLLRVKKRAT
jgi:phosphate transport system permease protein